MRGAKKPPKLFHTFSAIQRPPFPNPQSRLAPIQFGLAVLLVAGPVRYEEASRQGEESPF